MPVILVGLLFGELLARSGVVVVVEVWVSIWWLFGSTVDCILNRWVCGIFVSAAVVL